MEYAINKAYDSYRFPQDTILLIKSVPSSCLICGAWLYSSKKTIYCMNSVFRIDGELKKAAFLKQGGKPEVNISHARTVVSPRFST